MTTFRIALEELLRKTGVDDLDFLREGIYSGPRNLDTKTAGVKLQSSHAEEVFIEAQGTNRTGNDQGREDGRTAGLGARYSPYGAAPMALENLPQVFANEENVEAVKAEYEKKIEELYTEIGRLTTKLAWLEKKGLRVE